MDHYILSIYRIKIQQIYYTNWAAYPTLFQYFIYLYIQKSSIADFSEIMYKYKSK